MGMDSTINLQINTKTLLRTLTVISVFTLVLSIPLSSADAVPQDPSFGGECRDNEITLTVTCCWYESDDGDTILCQTCDINIETGDISKEDCKPSKPMPFKPSTSDYRPPLVSDRGPIKEQLGNQELQETPSFSTGNQEKVTPFNEDLTNQGLQQDSLSSGETEQDSEQGNSDNLDSSFAKRGNTQNSPVPPECPKQGPIPPDCTMKPKF
jgi:hypothetical protein